MKSLSEYPTRTFDFFHNSKYFVFRGVNASLFALNQSAIFESSELAKSWFFRFSEALSFNFNNVED